LSNFNNREFWAVILGGCSGIGLATAKKLARHGVNICIVHRDLKQSIPLINASFDELRSSGVDLKTFNVNAVDERGRNNIIDDLKSSIGSGKIKLLLHAISRGSLKILIPQQSMDAEFPDDIDPSIYQKFSEIDTLIKDSLAGLKELSDDDLSLTIQAMGTSLLSWTRDLLKNKMFCKNARVIGLTSEGNNKIWECYSAIASAKSAMESIVKYLAVELASYNITANVIQAGITDTQSLRMIPGNEIIRASTVFRNPNKRLTKPEDIANVIYLLCQDEANWVNGVVIPVDGGEHLM